MQVADNYSLLWLSDRYMTLIGKYYRTVLYCLSPFGVHHAYGTGTAGKPPANPGTITIYDGYFKGLETFDPEKGDDRYFVLNLKDNGGAFDKFNPTAALTEPIRATTPYNFVAESYESVETGEGTNIWTVRKIE